MVLVHKALERARALMSPLRGVASRDSRGGAARLHQSWRASWCSALA
jgi:hypothetical protein